ncbi:hypothetical protein [Cupriavidus sp. 8B]
MTEILNKLLSDSWSVAAYLAGIYCIATAAGISRGVTISNFSVPSPETKQGKTLMYAVGLSLFIFGAQRAIRFPEYKPAVFEKLVYEGTDAKQIVADGEDIYLLKENGNIYRLLRNGFTMVDPGTGTQQIAAAGGALYILKNNGNIWAYQPIHPRPEKSEFQLTDDGTGTPQIVVTGDTMYVLKKNGNIWRSTIAPSTTGNDDTTVENVFIKVDNGEDTKQITSAGSILYILKERGNILKYAPTLRQPFSEIYSNGDADAIKADGGALYFIRRDGTPCKYREPSAFEKERTAEQKNAAKQEGVAKQEDTCIAIEKIVSAKKIDALGGVAYILTRENKIFRYNAETDSVRELTEAGSDNRDIAAYYQDLFVIKITGSVKRYNEGRLKR